MKTSLRYFYFLFTLSLFTYPALTKAAICIVGPGCSASPNVQNQEAQPQAQVLQEQQKIADDNLRNTNELNLSKINTKINDDGATTTVSQFCGKPPFIANNTHEAIQKFDTDSVIWINCVKPLLNKIEIENEVTQKVLEKINTKTNLDQTPTTTTATNKIINSIVQNPVTEIKEKKPTNIVATTSVTVATTTEKNIEDLVVNKPQNIVDKIYSFFSSLVKIFKF